MKQLIRYSTAVFLLFAWLIPQIVFSFSASFSDVPSTNPSFLAVEYLKRNGFVQGVSDGTFGSTRSVKKTELLKLAISVLHQRLIFLVTQSPLPLFRDVKFQKQAWFSPYVATAKIDRIIEGNVKGEVNLGQTISRADAVAIMVKSAGFRAYDYRKLAVPFPDVPKDAWYAAFLRVATHQNLLPASMSGEKFSASKLMTRSELAEMLYRALAQQQKLKEVGLSNSLFAEDTAPTADVSPALPEPYQEGDKPADLVNSDPHARPDLAISGVEKSGPDDGIFQGSLKVTIENRGEAPVDGTNFCLYQRPDWYTKPGFNASTCLAAFGNGEHMPPLYPGRQFVFYVWGACNLTSKNTHEVLFAVDPASPGLDEVAESNEANNTFSYSCE